MPSSPVPQPDRRGPRKNDNNRVRISRSELARLKRGVVLRRIDIAKELRGYPGSFRINSIESVDVEVAPHDASGMVMREWPNEVRRRFIQDNSYVVTDLSINYGEESVSIHPEMVKAFLRLGHSSARSVADSGTPIKIVLSWRGGDKGTPPGSNTSEGTQAPS